MPNSHSIARSSRREELPLELRVYGLEGITQTQDEAIAKQALTLSDHDARLRASEVLTAVIGENQKAMQASLDAVVAELVKTRWTLVAFALTGIAAALGLS